MTARRIARMNALSQHIQKRASMNCECMPARMTPPPTGHGGKGRERENKQSKLRTMKKIICLFFASLVLMIMASCATSNTTTTIAHGHKISDYKYVVFGKEGDGDAELDDILMMVQNQIAENLQVVSSDRANSLVSSGENVLTPRINVKSEKWDGGMTYISVSLIDYYTQQSIAVVKSSGIGLTVAHDQRLAYKAIEKELNKVFK